MYASYSMSSNVRSPLNQKKVSSNFFFILKSFIIEFFHLCITHNSSTKIIFISKVENILRGP